MALHHVRVGDWKASVDIDDVDKADWRGVLSEAPQLHEGDVLVVLLGVNGEEGASSRARAVPGGPYQPAVLEGLEPFS